MLFILSVYAVVITLMYFNECRINEELQQKVDSALILAIREHCKRTTNSEGNLG